MKRKELYKTKKTQYATIAQRLGPEQNSMYGFKHIKDVIEDIFKTSSIPVDREDVRIWEIWDRVVGDKIAAHSRPSKIKNGILTVKVTDSIWLQELEFMEERIREKINSELNRENVSKIKFRVGTPMGRKL